MKALRLVIVLLIVGGCRQPDGAIESPEGEQANRVQDISRDLLNLAAKDAKAPGELLDDLSNLDATPAPAERLQELSQSLADALAGASLSAADAKQLATLLFTATTSPDQSEAQITQLSTDVVQTLTKVGAKPDTADRVATATAAVANEVTENRKRWYHR